MGKDDLSLYLYRLSRRDKLARLGAPKIVLDLEDYLIDSVRPKAKKRSEISS